MRAFLWVAFLRLMTVGGGLLSLLSMWQSNTNTIAKVVITLFCGIPIYVFARDNVSQTDNTR
jgi:hypothetical protein